MKQEIGFEVYLECVKGASSKLFLKFRSGTDGLFEEFGRHDKVGVSQECPNCGACKESIEYVLFECALYDSQILSLDFLDYLKTVLPPEAFKAFVCVSIFDKTAFSLGKKARYVGKQ